MRCQYLVLATIFVGGCASVASYSAVDLEGTDEHYVEGIPFVISDKERSTVALGPDSVAPDAGERPVFVIVIENKGAEEINLSPDQIFIETNTGERLASISAERLQKEARKKAKWAAIAAGLQAASNSMNAANAGYESGTATYSGTTNYYGTGGYGTANTYATATYSGYNAAAAAQARAEANAENDALMAQTSAQIDSIMASADYGAFQRHTLAPGKTYTSRVTFEKIPKSTQKIRVIMNVAGELHELMWNYSVE